MSTPEDLRSHVGGALYAQIGWAVLSSLWNVAGVVLIARGLRAPGPTASLTAGALLLAAVVGLVAFVTRWPIGYLGLSVLMGVMGMAAVVNAFMQDPALWPSEFWRYAGAALNSMGFLAAAAGCLAYLRWSKK